MKKFLSIFLALLMILSLSVPAFAEDTTKPLTDISDGSSDTSLDTSGFGPMLVSLFSGIIENIKKISSSELLNLPADAMANITTVIFRFLSILGINFDAIYEVLPGLLH